MRKYKVVWYSEEGAGHGVTDRLLTLCFYLLKRKVQPCSKKEEDKARGRGGVQA